MERSGLSIVELESPSTRLLDIVRTALGVAATARAATLRPDER